MACTHVAIDPTSDESMNMQHHEPIKSDLQLLRRSERGLQSNKNHQKSNKVVVKKISKIWGLVLKYAWVAGLKRFKLHVLVIVRNSGISH